MFVALRLGSNAWESAGWSWCDGRGTQDALMVSLFSTVVCRVAMVALTCRRNDSQSGLASWPVAFHAGIGCPSLPHSTGIFNPAAMKARRSGASACAGHLTRWSSDMAQGRVRGAEADAGHNGQRDSEAPAVLPRVDDCYD